MTKPEKVVLSTLLILLAIFAALLHNGLKRVEEEGGWSKVFIEAGKEVKHVVNEIKKD